MAPHSVLKGLEHHAVFLLLLQICVLLATARILGEVMRKLKQPPVVGELLAGVMLGPSVFGLAWPDLQSTVFPHVQSQADLLSVISWLGVLFLLIVTGLETDVRLILEKGATAIMISAGGIILPFASGIGLGLVLPDTLLVNPELRLVFALFMAVAMSISAVPVIAKVLFDLKLVRRDIGQLTLAAAMSDDTIGWILLSVVAGLATRGSVDLTSVGIAVGGALLFLTLAFTIGSRLIGGLITIVDEVGGGATTQLSLVLVIAFGTAALTHEMGIEAVLGAFVVGILVGQARRFRHEVAHTLEMITSGFVAPIFFASAGLKVDLIGLVQPEVLLVGIGVLTVACLGKLIGCYLGAWAGGLSHWERLAMGCGMNARGAMEIVVATVGLGLGVLTTDMFSIIVMVAIVTSLMAPPLLRWTLGNVPIGEAEAKRLANEEMAANSFARSIRRILLVASNAEQAATVTALIGLLSKAQPTETTAVYANLDESPIAWWQSLSRRSRGAIRRFRGSVRAIRQALREVAGASTQVRVATGPDATERVLTVASQGYDLIAMGVGDPRRSEGLFGQIVNRVVREANCATLVVKSRPNGVDPASLSIRRILVPTIGTDYSKHAVELASVLAATAKAIVTVLYVSEPQEVSTNTPDLLGHNRNLELANEIVDHQADVARKFGAEVETMVLEGSPETVILDVARKGSADLIVMGSSLRAVKKRAFLGQRVEIVLKSASCPVAVLSTI